MTKKHEAIDPKSRQREELVLDSERSIRRLALELQAATESKPAPKRDGYQ